MNQPRPFRGNPLQTWKRHAAVHVVDLKTGTIDRVQGLTDGRSVFGRQIQKSVVAEKKRKVDLVEEIEKQKLYLVADDGRPIPSNKWYQNLLFKQYGTGLWAMPHKVDATAEGIEVFYPTTFDGGGTRSVAEFPLVIG